MLNLIFLGLAVLPTPMDLTHKKQQINDINQQKHLNESIKRQEVMSNTITQLTKDNFDTFIGQDLVLVDFWAPWCGPCRALAPVLESVASKTNVIKIGKINIDEADSQILAARFNVRSIPTLVFFKKGQVLDMQVGLVSEADLLAKINTHAQQ